MIFRWFSKGREPEHPAKHALPTVRFEASRVTETVKADLLASINEFEDLPVGEEEAIYEVALNSITRGRDLGMLAKALTELGVQKARAAYIASFLHNRATSLMQGERALASGLTEAKWTYSGAPCVTTNPPIEEELRRDALHKAANGKSYPIASGMLMDGRRVFPGREPGCKCIGSPIVGSCG